MTPLPLRRVVGSPVGDGDRLAFRLDCGHVFTCDDRRVAMGIRRASHLRCATCAAVARSAASVPTRARLRERRCARCGQIDARPCYAPPPPACFRCRARLFVEFFEEEEA